MLIYNMNEEHFKIEMQKLKVKHHFEEMLMFQVWQQADEENREKIARGLGEKQAQEILDLIAKR